MGQAPAKKTTGCETRQQFGVDETDRDVAISLRQTFQMDLDRYEVRMIHVAGRVAFGGLDCSGVIFVFYGTGLRH